MYKETIIILKKNCFVRENIESLAMALTDIATRQAEHRNFQLVIITHDEEFIEQLSRLDFKT